MTRILAALLCVSTATLIATRQARPADEVTRVVFAANERGEPITDLRASDLVAVAASTPLQLLNVQAVAGGQRRGAVGAPDEGRMVAIVIDDAHVLPGDTPLLRQTLRVLRDEFLQPDDLVRVISTGRSSIDTDFRRGPDRTRVTTAIERAMGSASAPPAAPPELIRLALRTVADVADRAGRVPNSMKALLLVTSGYAIGGDALFTREPKAEPDVIAELARVVTAAADGSTVIYTIDPRGPRRGPPIDWPSTPEAWQRSIETSRTSMRALSTATAGRSFDDGTDLRAGLRTIDADLTNHYVLTLRSPGMSRLQGSAVRISTTRPGVTLRYAQLP